MAKRTSSRGKANGSDANVSQANDGEATRPKTSRSSGERGTALPNVEPLAPRAAEELPNIPEPGDLADQAAQSETMGVVPTASEARAGVRDTREGVRDTRESVSDTRESVRDTRESGYDTRSDSMGSGPSEEDIRLRAYHRYLERGAVHGAHFDDWLEAERELRESGRKDEV